MEKTLCWSIEDYIAKMLKLMEGINDSIEEIESRLGVEFAVRDENGSTCFLKEVTDWNALAYWELQEVAEDVFRMISPQKLPKQYPVLVLSSLEDGFDRCGGTKTRLIEFVYTKDFQSSQPTGQQ